MRKSPIRRLGAYLFFLVLAPLLLLAGAEGCLRLFGYGESTRPFVKKQLDGHQFYVRNLASVERYLSWQLPSDDWERVEHVIPRSKPPGAYRIFVFGESTPEGWPDPRFSFSRFLRVMLKAQFPGREIEVYNTAFRAVNSHVMRVQAAATAKFEPDLFIVYLGNNEVHGPFGLTKTNGVPDPLPSLTSIRTQIWLSEFRLFQAAEVIRRIVGFYCIGIEPLRARWHSRVCTDWSDPRVPTVFGYFDRNLHDICETGLNAGASVVLCTIPANLRHWRPVGSVHPPDLSDQDEERWQALYAEGQAKQEQGAYDRALVLYERAADLDATFADLQFRMGQCYWKASDFEDARTSFELALEYDAFPWVRSRARTNQIILDTLRHMESQGVQLADVREAVTSRSPHGCPGAELFFDHCHLNLDGTHIMAATLYRTIAPLVAAHIGKGANTASEPLPFDECLRRLALSPSSLRDYLRGSIDSPDPYDEEGRAILRHQLAEAEEVEAADAHNSVHDVYREALELDPGDYLLRYLYVQTLVTRFYWSPKPEDELEPWRVEALEQAQALAQRYPYHRGSLRLLGEAQRGTGRLEDALQTVQRTLQLYPDDMTIYRNWSGILLDANRPGDAWDVIQESPETYNVGDMGMLLQQKSRVREALGDRDGAIDFLSEAIKVWPDYAPQYHDLDGLLVDKPDRRSGVWQDILEILDEKKLDKKRAYFHLARARLSLRQIPEALQACRDASNNHQDDALNALISTELIKTGQALEAEGGYEDALLLYREALVYSPDNPDALRARNGLLDRTGHAVVH